MNSKNVMKTLDSVQAGLKAIKLTLDIRDLCKNISKHSKYKYDRKLRDAENYFRYSNQEEEK